jgi:hypothetical protein
MNLVTDFESLQVSTLDGAKLHILYLKGTEISNLRVHA